MKHQVRVKTKPEKSPRERASAVSSVSPARSPLHPLLNLQRSAGNHAVSRFIQAKLTVNPTGDVYEQEADAVAQKVMRKPEPPYGSPSDSSNSPGQRNENTRGGSCPKCAEEKKTIQRKPLLPRITSFIQRRMATKPKEYEEDEEDVTFRAKEAPGQAPVVSPTIENRISSLQDGGQPLSPSVRTFFEPRFGDNFKMVRFHNNIQAANTAQMLNARAFTIGRNVVFGGGQYSPETREGKKLIGHELVHVMQQRKNPSRTHVVQLQEAPVEQPEEAPTEQPAEQSALTTFTGTNFTGEAVQCDVNFVPSLQTIDTYAGNRGVQVHVTSSFRQQGQAVAGAVVQPATSSNHHAGHAIDMNVRYQGTLYNSTQLNPNNLSNLPQAVQNFINDIQNDTNLRWGGDFTTTDPVHIDDGLNVNNPTTFQERVTAVQAAAQGGGQ